MFELGHRAGESAGRQYLDVGQAPDQTESGPAGGMADRDRPLGRFAVGGHREVFAPLIQVGSAVPHRRKDQMRLLTMKPSAGEHRPGFDHQHVLVGVVDEVRAELVAEQPTA